MALFPSHTASRTTRQSFDGGRNHSMETVAGLNLLDITVVIIWLIAERVSAKEKEGW